jgi:hypothetical protein
MLISFALIQVLLHAVILSWTAVNRLMFEYLGSTCRATLVAFNDRERYCGEEAFAHIMGDSTVPMFNQLMGKTLAEVKASDELSMLHRKVPITADSGDRLQAEILYGNERKPFHITALTGMYLAKLNNRIKEDTPGCITHISLALPVHHKNMPSVERAYKEACTIAGFDMSKVFFTDAADCLVATYTRKLSGLAPSDRSYLEVCSSLILRARRREMSYLCVGATYHL